MRSWVSHRGAAVLLCDPLEAWCRSTCTAVLMLVKVLLKRASDQSISAGLPSVLRRENCSRKCLFQLFDMRRPGYPAPERCWLEYVFQANVDGSRGDGFSWGIDAPPDASTAIARSRAVG